MDTVQTLDFSGFIADRTKDFTGREWVFTEIDRWLADPQGPSFFVVTGAPGLGKSAIAARLTQVRNLAAFHFCIARQADTIDPALFARSLSHQLCRFDGFARGILKDSTIDLKTTQNVQANYGQVIGAKIENLVVNAPSGSVAFTHAVIQPLKALCADGYDQQVVLLVDALDEAVQHKGSETIVDLLANAGALPRQVRLVLTSRPDGEVLRHFEEQRIPHFRLDASRPENLQDIRRYVRGQLQLETSEGLRTRLADQRTPHEVFVERVTTVSQGNFLYVVWLLRDVAAGTQRFDTLEALPQELDGIYREFLRTRTIGEDKRSWRKLYRPIIGALVASQAPLTAKQVAQFTKLSDQDVDDGLQDLRQFLDPASANEGRYFMYHQSVNDWLQDQVRSQEFWIDVTPAHQSIVEYYRNGASNWDAVNWQAADDYGLRYLVTHLEGAGRTADLLRLLSLDRSVGDKRENVWFVVKEAAGDLRGYLADVERAWRLAKAARDVGAQVRCALYSSSVRNIGFKVPASLLELALKYGVLTWQHTLALARMNQVQVDRAEILARLAPLLPAGVDRDEALAEAFDTAGAIDDISRRAGVLSALAPHLPERLLDDAFEAAIKIGNDRDRASVLSALVPYLPEHLLKDAFEAARTIDHPLSRIRVSGRLAPRLSDDQRDALLAEAMVIAREMDPDVNQVVALCELAPQMNKNSRTETVDLALAVAKTLDYSDGLAQALAALAQQNLTEQQLVDALQVARWTYEHEDHAGVMDGYAYALFALGPHLSTDQRNEFVGKFLTELESDSSWLGNRAYMVYAPFLAPYLPKDQQVDVFTKVLPRLIRQAAGSYRWDHEQVQRQRRAAQAAVAQLPPHLLDAAQESASKIASNDSRAEVLFVLVPRLPQDQRAAVLDAELIRVRAIHDESAQAQALAALAPYLAKEQREDVAIAALRAAHSMGWNRVRFEVIAELVPHLPNDRAAAILGDALRTVREMTDAYFQWTALTALASCLLESNIPAGFEIAETISGTQPAAFAVLAHWLTNDQRQGAIQKVLQEAHGWWAEEMPRDFVTALRSLVPYMEEAQVSDALEITGRIKGRGDEAYDVALAVLAPHLSEHLLTQAFVDAQDTPNDLSRIRALAALAPHLSGQQRAAAMSEALKTANALENNQSRVSALAALAPRLSDNESIVALAAALETAMAIDGDDYRAQALCDLLPCLSGTQRLDAFESMLDSCLGVKVAAVMGSNTIRKSLDRGFLLQRIAEAAKALAGIGGESAVGDTESAIREAALWWP